ncbi:SPJ_0845 family protein [Streptococcus hyovaginalis]|nr:SPJ_0845 family protein [Streptococcus hyovaginalis]MDY4510187.1 SPJ_0845 family protein [Streptococcus hyovaginalis]
MAISYKKDDKLESMFANFAKLPDNMDSDLKKRKKDDDKKEKDN